MTEALRDPERALALAYVPPQARNAVHALFQLDERLAEILRTTTEPMLGQMRFTWWNEALSGIGTGAPTAEPLLTELAALVEAGSLDARELLPLIEGWEELLEPLPLGDASLAAFSRSRGRTLFRAAARAIGVEPPSHAAAAGEAWALVDLAFHISDRSTAERALSMAQARLPDARGAWPRPLRALGLLAVLARRDAGAGLDAPRVPGSPGRVVRALWHGVTGR